MPGNFPPTGSDDRPQQNGWNVWSKYVSIELDRITKCNANLATKIEETNKEMRDLSKELIEAIHKNSLDISNLKVKSGVWGLIGGLLPVLIALSIYLIKIFG